VIRSAALKRQDILLLARLTIEDASFQGQMQMAAELQLPQSEICLGMRRLIIAGLLESRKTRKLHLPRVAEFIVHGLRYCFPAEAEEKALGLSIDSSFLPKSSQKKKDRLVWLCPGATDAGTRLVPLLPTVPTICSTASPLRKVLGAFEHMRAAQGPISEDARSEFEITLESLRRSGKD
jgi:hypothetical protein